ncbi:MAG: M50 family metallopeptidase [Nitrososphaeraceae archaeon]
MQKNTGIRPEVKFPLILIHTPYGLKFFDKVAKTSFGKIYAKFNIYLMPIITALALFLIVSSLFIMVSNVSAREGVKGIGPQANLLIPGLNPYLPITYGLAALFVTIVIHEAGHGIVARVYNVRVDSTGVVLFAIFPIGAFVNIERDELDKISLKQKSAILTAGPLNNMILAFFSLGLLYLVVSSLTPIDGIERKDIGINILTVNENSLANSIGLTPDSVLTSINGQDIDDIEKLGQLLRSNLGNTIEITWTSSDDVEFVKQVQLPNSVPENQGILGVTISNLSPDPSLVLDRYKSAFSINPLAILLPPTLSQGSVPYSDLMSPNYESNLFGPSYPILANFLFWIWFINFNVGIFNALPIGPLDGGQLYGSLLERKSSRNKSSILKPSTLLTIGMIVVIALSLALPWII